MKWVKLWLKCYISCINSLKTCLRVKSDGCKCWKRLKIDRKQLKIVRKQFKIVRKAVKRPTWYGFSSHLFNRSSNVSPTRPEGAEALSPLAKLELFKFVRKVIMFVCVVIPNLCQWCSERTKATIYFYAFIFYNDGHRQVTFWVLPIW